MCEALAVEITSELKYGSAHLLTPLCTSSVMTADITADSRTLDGVTVGYVYLLQHFYNAYDVAEDVCATSGRFESTNTESKPVESLRHAHRTVSLIMYRKWLTNSNMHIGKRK
jgi:hypothetical protein